MHTNTNHSTDTDRSWDIDPLLDEATLPPRRHGVPVAKCLSRQDLVGETGSRPFYQPTRRLAVRHWMRPALVACAAAGALCGSLWVAYTGQQAMSAEAVAELADEALVEQALRGADGLTMLAGLGVTTPERDAWVTDLLGDDSEARLVAADDVVGALSAGVASVSEVPETETRRMEAVQARLDELQRAARFASNARSELTAARATPGGKILSAVGVLDS